MPERYIATMLSLRLLERGRRPTGRFHYQWIFVILILTCFTQTACGSPHRSFTAQEQAISAGDAVRVPDESGADNTLNSSPLVNACSSLLQNHLSLALAGAIILVVSAYMMQRSIRVFSIRRPTIPAVFYLTFIGMIYIPSFFVFQDHPGSARDMFIASVMVTMITVPLGIMLANFLHGYQYSETENYIHATPTETADLRGMFSTHVFVVILMILILASYLYRTPVIPIFEVFSNQSSPDQLVQAREESFKLLDPRWQGPNSTKLFAAYLFLRTLMFPFIIMTTLGYALLTRNVAWWIMAGLVFVVGIFYAASSLARAPISAIFMRCFFFLYLYFGGRISKKVVAGFIPLLLLFPLLVTMSYHKTSSVIDGLAALGTRFTYTPSLDLYYYFEVFPEVKGYLWGQTLVKPILEILGEKYFYIENYVALYISPNGVKTAHANAAFISNLFADFGIYGVILGTALCGYVMQLTHICLARSAKTILNMAVYSFMIYAIWVLNFGSVTSVLLVNGVLPVVVLAIGLRYAAGKLGSIQTRVGTQ